MSKCLLLYVLIYKISIYFDKNHRTFEIRYFNKKKKACVFENCSFLGTRVYLLGAVKELMHEFKTDPKWKDSKV